MQTFTDMQLYNPFDKQQSYMTSKTLTHDIDIWHNYVKAEMFKNQKTQKIFNHTNFQLSTPLSLLFFKHLSFKTRKQKGHIHSHNFNQPLDFVVF